MNALKYSLLLASAAFALPSVFASPLANSSVADPIAIKVVRQQFINAKIVPNEVATFNPIGLLQVNFKGKVGVTAVGQAIAKADVQSQPALTAIGAFNGTSSKYTVLMVDANYAGSSNPNGIYLHWLQNDATLNSDGTITNSTPSVIPYCGPAPPTGSGPHRYTLLLFAQPTNFTAPSTPAPDSGPSRVKLTNLAHYLASANLGTPLVGSYFTVQVGTATVTVSPTTAVDAATFSASPTSSGSARSGSSTTTSTSSTSSPSKKSNSASQGSATIGAVLLSAFGLAVALV